MEQRGYYMFKEKQRMIDMSVKNLCDGNIESGINLTELSHMGCNAALEKRGALHFSYTYSSLEAWTRHWEMKSTPETLRSPNENTSSRSHTSNVLGSKGMVKFSGLSVS